MTIFSGRAIPMDVDKLKSFITDDIEEVPLETREKVAEALDKLFEKGLCRREIHLGDFATLIYRTFEDFDWGTDGDWILAQVSGEQGNLF